MNRLAEILRDLMDCQKLTGAKLAEEIGLSATSVSHILTGKSHPRQVTLSRMMKLLCESKEDEQALLAAYEATGQGKLPVSPILDDEQNAESEEARVRQFLQMKTQAVAFRNAVTTVLEKMPFNYQSEVSKGYVITDFLIEKGGKRIALECRANVKRDLEKSLLSARIIWDELKCDRVYIVVPERDDDLRKALSGENGINCLESRNLTKELSKI